MRDRRQPSERRKTGERALKSGGNCDLVFQHGFFVQKVTRAAR